MAGFNLYPKDTKRGTQKTCIFLLLAILVTSYIIRENVQTPQAQLITVPITSFSTLQHLFDESHIVNCPCSQPLTLGSFARFSYDNADDADMNMSTNICGTIHNLANLLTDANGDKPVSYTHLTLPTIYSV